MEKDNSIVFKLPKYFQLHYLIDLVAQSCVVGRDNYFTDKEIKERKSVPKVLEPS